MREEENDYNGPFFPGFETEKNPKCNEREGNIAFKTDSPPRDKAWGK